jgi:hypothetical protein
MTALPNGAFQGTAASLGILSPGAFNNDGLTDLYVKGPSGVCGVFYGTQTPGI